MNLISEAKALLMERNNLTEEEAHRYMQKRSMDNGTGLTETAQMILKCTIFPLHHPIKIRASKGGFQFWVCQIAQNRTCFVPLSENKKN